MQNSHLSFKTLENERSMQTIEIREVEASEKRKNKVDQGLIQDAKEKINYDGEIHNFSFAAFFEEEEVAAILGKMFFGALHLENLHVKAECQRQGIGKMLMHSALDYAKKRACKVVFLETFNFQALPFYQKLGFSLEFSREGYKNGCVFHYLKKEL